MGAGIPGTAIGMDLEKSSGGDLLWRSCTVPLGELCPLPQVRPMLCCPWGGRQSPAGTGGVTQVLLPWTHQGSKVGNSAGMLLKSDETFRYYFYLIGLS